MTQQELILGKRYRWTVEGMGVDIGDGEVALETEDHRRCFGPHLLADGTLEKLTDPLPTTPGSVVRLNGGTFLRLVPDYGMPWVDSASECWDDAHLEGATVLFDTDAVASDVQAYNMAATSCRAA